VGVGPRVNMSAKAGVSVSVIVSAKVVVCVRVSVSVGLIVGGRAVSRARECACASELLVEREWERMSG
jgi:hypothetical protein